MEEKITVKNDYSCEEAKKNDFRNYQGMYVYAN